MPDGRRRSPVFNRLEPPVTNDADTPQAAIPRLGYVYVILAAVMWAVSGASAKFLFQNGMTPLQLVQLRVTLGAVFLIAWLALRHRSLFRIAWIDIPYFLALGILGLAMVNCTYMLAISKIKVAAAILLEYLAPVFIALYSLIFLKDRLKPITITAIVGAIVGCYLMVGGYNLDLLSMNREGVIYGLASAVAFAWYSVFGERGMRRYPPWTVLFYSVLAAALFWNGAHFLWEGFPKPFESVVQPYSGFQWLFILYVVILGTMVPFGLYLDGVNLIRSTRASVTATLEPITAGVISYIFLGESLEIFQIAGGILVIGSIVLLQVRKEYDNATPALIRSRSAQSSEAS
jgi:drug/metabolite transporter (DMT)-like permease